MSFFPARSVCRFRLTSRQKPGFVQNGNAQFFASLYKFGPGVFTRNKIRQVFCFTLETILAPASSARGLPGLMPGHADCAGKRMVLPFQGPSATLLQLAGQATSRNP